MGYRLVTLSDEERADQLAKSNASQTRILASLEPDKQSILAFHDIAERIFREKTEGATYKRKPGVALRLQEDNVRLTATPSWNKYAKTLNCSELRLELLTEQKATTGGKEGIKLDWLFHFKLTPDWPPTLTKMHIWPPCEDTSAFCRIIRDFVQDPLAVLGRNSDNCGICGRCLTDGASRSRGIGPECIRLIDFALFSESVFALTEKGTT